MMGEPRAKLDLSLVQVGYVKAALNIAACHLHGPRAEFALRELMELLQDIDEQIQEQFAGKKAGQEGEIPF